MLQIYLSYSNIWSLKYSILSSITPEIFIDSWVLTLTPSRTLSYLYEHSPRTHIPRNLKDCTLLRTSPLALIWGVWLSNLYCLDIWSVVIIICLVFFSFNNKFELVDQSSKVRIVLFDSAVAASSFKGKQWVIGVVSPAYWNAVQSSTSSRSFTYKFNNTGPKMDPCGTPNLVSRSSDVLSLTCTNCRPPLT